MTAKVEKGSRVFVRRFDDGVFAWQEATVTGLNLADERIMALVDGESTAADYHLTHVRIPPSTAD